MAPNVNSMYLQRDQRASVFPHHLLLLALAESKQSEVDYVIDAEKKSYENQSEEVLKEESGELRKICEVSCTISSSQQLSIFLRFEDNMNRDMKCSVSEGETAEELADELVQHGLINQLDQDLVKMKISEQLVK